MPKTLDIDGFIKELACRPAPLVDVRSPQEYSKGHIPGAVSIPLFMDEERAVVGTMYKQQGREQAIRKGLEIVGPKMRAFVDRAGELAPGKQLYLHCWRGGMRSESMAWLFELSGFQVTLLKGGYKAYRKQVQSDFARSWQLRVLGGKTGSGKTAILHALAALGEQVLDLEGVAHHKGSAFGALLQPPQPTVEQFENDLHQALMQLDPSRIIWVEDESHAIGRVYVPLPFWRQMQSAAVWVIELPLEERVQRLVREYAEASDEDLAHSLKKIEKRLGRQHLQRAISALEAGDYATVARIALEYYDKAYSFGLSQKEGPRKVIHVTKDDPEATARLLVQQAAQPPDGKSTSEIQNK